MSTPCRDLHASASAPVPARRVGRSAALLALPLLACTTTLESSTAYEGAPSAQAIPIAGYTLEAGSYVYVQALTSLGTSARDPAATWQSIAAFPAGTSPTRSGGTSYYAWGGTLTGFTSGMWPSGGVARLRVLHRANGAYTPAFTFDDTGCLLDNAQLDFEDRAHACASHDNGYLHLVDGDPVRASTLQYISLRETPRLVVGGAVVSDPAADYYAVVDPASERTTLAAWQRKNGFDSVGRALLGYEPAISATYYNHGDLELGRQMNCVKKAGGNDRACYVTNYGDPAGGAPAPGDAAAPALAAAIARTVTGVVATVAMEYRPNAVSNRVTFYAYDGAGARVSQAVLDSEGAKTLPGACLSCHGGRFDAVTDSVNGAHFLPFDVDNFSYSSSAGFTLAAQQDAFRALNQFALGTGPTAAISELVNGWYGSNLGTSGPDQDTDFVPVGWAGQEVVYREAIKPYCRGCHVALDDVAAAPAIFDLNTYDELSAFRLVAQDRMCELYDMPHAEVTRKNFWTSPARGHLIGEFGLATACD